MAENILLIGLFSFVLCLAAILLFIGILENRRPEDDEQKKWFHSYWLKLFAFAVFTPLWFILVWVDKKEKKSIRIFSLVWLAAFLVYCIVYSISMWATPREITYRASGTRSGFISYADNMTNDQIVQIEKAFPWERTFNAKKGTVVGVVVLSNYEGFSQCEIYVNGELVSSQVSYNYFLPAGCSVEVP